MLDSAQNMPHINNEAQFLCFCLDDAPDAQIYAINVFKIREVIYQEGDFAHVVGGEDSAILGILSIRGESIALIDVRSWLYDFKVDLKRDFAKNNRDLIMVCNFSNHIIGLKIAQVRQIIQRSWMDVRASSDYGIRGQKIIATTHNDDGNIIQILDVEQMLSDIFPMLGYHDALMLDGLERIESDKLVLIAEDSVSVSHGLKHIIRLMGLECKEFSDGEELIIYLESLEDTKGIGIIITDIEMPKISGFEVLKKIRSNPNLEHIPVIINSSMDGEANRQSAYKIGADAFINKSEPDEIIFYLKQFLQKE